MVRIPVVLTVTEVLRAGLSGYYMTRCKELQISYQEGLIYLELCESPLALDEGRIWQTLKCCRFGELNALDQRHWIHLDNPLVLTPAAARKAFKESTSAKLSPRVVKLINSIATKPPLFEFSPCYIIQYSRVPIINEPNENNEPARGWKAMEARAVNIERWITHCRRLNVLIIPFGLL